MESLPLELMLLVAADSAYVCFVLLTNIRSIGEYSLTADGQRHLKRLLTVTVTAFDNKHVLHQLNYRYIIHPTEKPKGSSVSWFCRNEPHRIDGPAILAWDTRGNLRLEKWFIRGKLHRFDGPAKFVASASRNITKYEWYRNGNLHREDGPAVCVKDSTSHSQEWYLAGKRHREDGPAFIIEHGDGSTEETWCQDDRIFRDELPAYIKKNAQGIVVEECWHTLRSSGIHRKDAPARIHRDDNGVVTVECWYDSGKLHRKNCPAVHRFINYSTSNLRSESADSQKCLQQEWWKAGNLHRKNGPAIVKEDRAGIRSQSWWRNGKLHRENAPALLEHNANGEIVREEWRRNGSLHREGAPALIIRTDDGTLVEELWENGARLNANYAQQAAGI